ncbi:hypothetical protein ABG067_001762 [Albugo candida]
MSKFFSPRSKVATFTAENDKGSTSKQSMIGKLKSKLTTPKRPAQEPQQNNNHVSNEESSQNHASGRIGMMKVPNDEVTSSLNPEMEEMSPSGERDRTSNDLASPASSSMILEQSDDKISDSHGPRESEQKYNTSSADSDADDKGCERPDLVKSSDANDLMIFGVSPARMGQKRNLKPEQEFSIENENEKQGNRQISPSKSASTPVVPSLALERISNRKSEEEAKSAPIHSVTCRTDKSNLRSPDVPILASSLIGMADVIETDENLENSVDYDPAAAITREFGERVVRLLGADAWVDRQDGLDAVQYAVKKAKLKSMRSRSEYFCAAIAAIQYGVEDRVSPVVFCALQCFRTIAESFAPYLDTSYAVDPHVRHTVAAFTKALITKLGDTNKRTNSEVKEAVVRLVKLENIDASVHVLLYLQRGELPIRVQVNTLHHLMREMGFPQVENKGLSTTGVFPIALASLENTDSKTRIAAIDFTADLIVNDEKLTISSIKNLKSDVLESIRRRVDDILAIKSNESPAQESDESRHDEEDQSKGMELITVVQEDSNAFLAFVEEQWIAACAELGPVISRKLESKVWSDRKEAFVDFEKRIGTDVNQIASSELQTLFVLYCTCVYKYLLDPIAPVVHSVMDTYMILIEKFGPNIDFRDKSVREIILQLMMRLSAVMKKANTRMSRSACRCIMKMTRLAHNNTHPLRYILSCVFLGDMEFCSQMHLLRLLIPEFGFHSDGIDPHRVMTCVANVFLNGDDKARKAAADVVVCTQRSTGKDFVLKYLKDLKPTILKDLEKNFVDAEASRANDSDRPQTVHFNLASHDDERTSVTPSVILHPTQSEAGNETNWRTLHSAPVGAGTLQCFSTQEEHMMDSILDSFR